MPAFRAAEILRFCGRRIGETWGEACASTARQIVLEDPSSTTMIPFIGYAYFIQAKSLVANSLSPYTGMKASTAGRASLVSPFVGSSNRYQATCEFSKAVDV
jgi:hypothetical protein